ncbi:PF09917 family protein [Leptospira interrogans]|nr:PF09917 family protein [Leptospira interrogans]
MNKSKLIAIFFAFVLISRRRLQAKKMQFLENGGIRKKDAQVDVHKCGAKICGKIVWLKEPTYPADSKEGTPGSPKIDVHNKDESLRTRPILGLVFLTGFSYEGEQIWTGGRVYDPKGGKTYDGRLTLRNADTLDLKGGYKVGFMMIGKESTWTRVK